MGDVLTEIRSCCRGKHLATLTAASHDLILPVRFKSLTGESVRLEVLSDQGLEEPFPETDCTVIFGDPPGTSLFVSRVVGTKQGMGEFPQIALQLPQRIVSGENRKTLRVPLHRHTNLEVTVKEGGKIWNPSPIDISLGGILVEFPEGEFPGYWTEETCLTVQLELGDKTTELEGFPYERDSRSLAIYFPAALRELRHRPSGVPSVLREIVESLEGQWLIQRFETTQGSH